VVLEVGLALNLKLVYAFVPMDGSIQKMIEKAVEWTLKRKFNVEFIPTEQFVKILHLRMYDDVWKRAGSSNLVF
jgi:hypothetical protein